MSVASAFIAGFFAISLLACTIFMFLVRKAWYFAGWSILVLFGFPSLCLLGAILLSSWPTYVTPRGLAMVSAGWLGTFIVPAIAGVLTGGISLFWSDRPEKWIVFSTPIWTFIVLNNLPNGENNLQWGYPGLVGVVGVLLMWVFFDSRPYLTKFRTELSGPEKHAVDHNYAAREGSEIDTKFSNQDGLAATRIGDLEHELSTLRKIHELELQLAALHRDIEK